MLVYSGIATNAKNLSTTARRTIVSPLKIQNEIFRSLINVEFFQVLNVNQGFKPVWQSTHRLSFQTSPMSSGCLNSKACPNRAISGFPELP